MHHRPARLAVVLLGMVTLVSASGAGTAEPVIRCGVPVVGRVDPGLGQPVVNWSGYAEPGSFTSIGGSWTVPAVSAPPGATTYASTWIGVDGLANRDLIQTGTESDVLGGVVHYDAWWEVLPCGRAGHQEDDVQPGDHMTASIVRGAAARWTVTLTDVTTGASFSIDPPLQGLRRLGRVDPGASAGREGAGHPLPLRLHGVQRTVGERSCSGPGPGRCPVHGHVGGRPRDLYSVAAVPLEDVLRSGLRGGGPGPACRLRSPHTSSWCSSSVVWLYMRGSS